MCPFVRALPPYFAQNRNDFIFRNVRINAVFIGFSSRYVSHHITVAVRRKLVED